MSVDSIAITLASLVKSNKGLWKSSKQAEFIRSQCHEKDMFATTNIAKSTLFYYLDDVGVVKVEKYTIDRKLSIVYDRNVDPAIALRKHYLRNIKKVEKSIAERLAARSEFVGYEELYEKAMEDDNIALKELQILLLELGN